MTESDPIPKALPLRRWQTELLQRIHDLSADFVRINDLGPDGYDGTDGDPTKDWLDHLDALSAVRESTERIAASVGIPARWIDRARNTGAGQTPQASPDADTTPASESKQFYHDMLSVDLWNLERMAFVAAARQTRLERGTYAFGADPITQASYRRNMTRLHQRVSALADAAEIDTRDVETLWGSSDAIYLRQVTGAALNGWDDLTVESAWRKYSIPSIDAEIPSYIPIDPATGRPHRHGVHPPTPEQLIADASQAMSAENAAAAPQFRHVDAAINAIIPPGATWQWQHEPVEDRSTTQPPELDRGPDP